MVVSYPREVVTVVVLESASAGTIPRALTTNKAANVFILRLPTFCIPLRLHAPQNTWMALRCAQQAHAYTTFGCSLVYGALRQSVTV